MKSRKLLKLLSTMMIFSIIIVGLNPFRETKVKAYTTIKSDKVAYITTANVNIRKGPGTSYDSYGTIPKNTVLHYCSIEGVSGDWIKIEIIKPDGSEWKSAYVSRSYTKKLECSREYTNTQNLNVRVKPSTSSFLLYTSPKGSPFHIYHTYTINADGYTWVPDADALSFEVRIGSSKYAVKSCGWVALKYLK